MREYVRKSKDFFKSCPICGEKLEFDIINKGFNNYHKKYCYWIKYECINDCKLSFEEEANFIETNEPVIWYEEIKNV